MCVEHLVKLEDLIGALTPKETSADLKRGCLAVTLRIRANTYVGGTV